MWEAPNRPGVGARGASHGGDALGGPPDPGRPANPWPRLIAFALTVLAGVFLVGLCVVSFANPPKRELKVELEQMAVGVPRFFPVTTFGADDEGFTYGAWVTVFPDRTYALLSLGTASRCNLRWEPAARAGGETGAFVDRCGPSRFDVTGRILEGDAARDLDAFPTRRSGTAVYVDVTQITLGACRDSGGDVCSRPGRFETRNVPNNALPPDFGRK